MKSNQAVAIILTLMFLSGCAELPHYDSVSNANAAIQRRDWVLAYKCIELDLISPSQDVRGRALSLIDKHPEIKDGARQSFSRDALMSSSYFYETNTAYLIEKNRLEYYRQSIAGPDDYQNAKQNFQETFKLFESSVNEYQVAMDAHRVKKDWSMASLIETISKPGQSRMEIISIFGRPSRVFEKDNIVTWWLIVKDNKCEVGALRTSDVTHNLVLSFDKEKNLRDYSVIRVIKNEH